MTVFSINQRHIIATRFDGKFLPASVHAQSPRRVFSRQAAKRRMLHVAAFVSIFAFFGILGVGVSSIKLLFEIQSAKRTLAELTNANEELRLQASAKSSPDILWKEAPLLELSQATNIRYVTFERNVLAGGEAPAP